MFTVQQMKAAHAKVKSGADFPKYVQEIKSLGLAYYEYLVTNGTTVYHGENGYEVKSDPIYENTTIANPASAEKLRNYIQAHQQGLTDFLTICRQAAEAGVEKWVVDTQKMMCTYYDLAGNEMMAEPIPDGHYAK